MSYVTCHPSKRKWAEGYAAGLQQQYDEDDEIHVVTMWTCPPERIFLTDKPLPTGTLLRYGRKP